VNHLSPFTLLAVIPTHAGRQGEAHSLALPLRLLVELRYFFGQKACREETASKQFEQAFEEMRKTCKLPIFTEVYRFENALD
jgi:hypothetical protein